MIATASIVATLALDTIVGEPPESIHPVALLGRVLAPLDREWPYPRLVGTLIAICVPLAVGVTLAALTQFAGATDSLATAIFASLVLFSTTSLRSLLAAATVVIDATDDALETARNESIALVGRGTEDLSAGDLRSAAVESATENLADGLVAPLLAFSLGALVSLPLAVAAAGAVKTVNTLDSMLGYRDKPVGWASARLDDVVMWVPARVTAILIAMAAASLTTLSRARAWAGTPSSPNSGWPMATMAAALDVRLEKPDAYVLNPDAAAPTMADAQRGVRIVGLAGVGSFVLAGVIAWF